jgi:hypothetical protein
MRGRGSVRAEARGWGLAWPRVPMIAGLLASVLLLSSAAPRSALAAGDANRPSCPQATEESPGFRSYLPDCRAYEMVTPPYKQGQAVHFNGLEAGGEALFGWSLASLAQSEGAPQTRGSVGAEYAFRRGISGWTTTALTPPNPEFRGAVSFEALAPDGGSVLFKMPTAPVGNDHFWLRDPGGGLADVGPATPPADGPSQDLSPQGPPPGVARFAGASEDMSHIVFSLAAPWGWPGDTTAPGGEDLYEYTGTGNVEPTMVAVEGGGRSAALIGDCGATLGGPKFTSAFDAVSSSGEVVVFTPVPADELECGAAQPAHAELYARIDGERTVWLSEPQCEPGGCPRSTPSAAVFQGAAPGGERGWFLSTEQLTAEAVDDPEPGDSASGIAGSGCQSAVGSGCNLYEYDLARPSGERLRAVSLGSPHPHVQGVVRVSPDGSHVYFLATGLLTALPGPGGSEPAEGQDNLYVSESTAAGASALRFVATLAEGDGELWGGSLGSDASRPAATSADGTALLFISNADLTGDGGAAGPQLFLYRDGASPTLRQISVAEEGSAGGGEGFPARIPAPDYEGREAFRPQAAPLSADGEVAVFESAAALTPDAGPPGGPTKLYEYRDGRVYLLDPDPDGSSRLLGLSGSGRDVFFQTARPLVPADGDTIPDIYDARAEGGLAEPDPPGGCSGEGCLSPPPPAGGALAPPASLTVHHALQVRRASLRRALRACRHKDGRARRRCAHRVRRRFLRGARR